MWIEYKLPALQRKYCTGQVTSSSLSFWPRIRLAPEYFEFEVGNANNDADVHYKICIFYACWLCSKVIESKVPTNVVSMIQVLKIALQLYTTKPVQNTETETSGAELFLM